MRCRKCGARNPVKNGKPRGLQRYRCRRCRYTFTREHDRGTPPAVKALAVLMYCLEYRNADQTATLFGVAVQTLYKWWHDWHAIPTPHWVVKCSKTHATYQNILRNYDNMLRRAARQRHRDLLNDRQAVPQSFEKYFAEECLVNFPWHIPPYGRESKLVGAQRRARQVSVESFSENSQKDIARLMTAANREANISDGYQIDIEVELLPGSS